MDMNRRLLLQMFGAATGTAAAAPAIVSASSLKAALGLAGAAAVSAPDRNCGPIGSVSSIEDGYVSPYALYPDLEKIRQEVFERPDPELADYDHMKSWSASFKRAQVIRDTRERRREYDNFRKIVENPERLALFAAQMGWKALTGD